jgi:flagella basal body P-ring formation protein FlgA
MKYVIRIVPEIILAFLLTCQAHANIIIRFKPHITTHAQRLGDLLDISGDKTHLANIPLDSMPRSGQKITKNHIINWLKKKKRVHNYKWRGKTTAVIQQLTRTSGIDLLNKAQLALKSQLEQHNYLQIEISSKAKLQNSSLPLSSFTVQIQKEYPTAKKVCVRLRSGRHSIPVWFSVKAYQNVLVAQHHIKNRTIVHDNDFILKTRNIAGLKDIPYNRLPQTIWLKKSINTDQILTPGFLTDPPFVIKGQSVQVKIVNHGISITTEAIAQKDGFIGQKVTMKNTQTHKYFLAVITAPNQAEIPS